MKNLNKNEIELVSGGCEDSRSWCIPVIPGQAMPGPVERPVTEPVVWQDPYVAPEAPFGT